MELTREINKICNTLKKNSYLSITDIVRNTRLNRSVVRTALAFLYGAGRISVKQIGMAKVYFLEN